MLLLYPGRINNLFQQLSTNEIVSRRVAQTGIVPALICGRSQIGIIKQCNVVVSQISVPVMFDNAC